MGIIITPPPSIVSGSSLTIQLDKTSDVSEYAVTFDGIPPILAKYIAYDSLTPPNPFIATVEDGRGNILLDGGFPKWYNDYANTSWTTYSQMDPAYKYLSDAIDFISNKDKVQSGNRKILIIGDQEPAQYYSIKDAGGGRGGFKTSIDTVCRIKGITPTYKTPVDYAGGLLDATYQEIDQYFCVLFFSTVFTNAKLITNNCIQSLISYRENNNGIFFITDHGDRDLTSVSEAINTDNSGFYRTANFVVSNFGCYFSGNYNRTPVNVGFLRANYGNHILWANLLDSDYIPAGGSESKVVVTTYPLYSGQTNKTITADGYIQVKVLVRLVNGTTQIENFTYGKNVPEIIHFSDKDNIAYTNEVYTTNILHTFLKSHLLNFRISYAGLVQGIIKIDNVPVGTFSYSGTGIEVTKTFNSGKTNEIILNDSQDFTIQITSPLSYTKTLKILFPKPIDTMRPNRVIAFANNYEFLNSDSTSKIRNVNKLLNNKNLPLNHFINRFKYSKIPEYFKTPGTITIPGNPTQTVVHPITFNFGGTGIIAYDMEIVDETYLICTDKGIISSPDYETWTKIPESGILYISSIYRYNNYIVAGLTSSRVLLSRDKGVTWSILNIGDAHISSVYITNISGVDYLFVGTQQGTVLKYNLNTSQLIYTIPMVANLNYVRDMVWYNGNLVAVGYKSIAYISPAGVLTKIDNVALGIGYEDINHLCITPNGLYCNSQSSIYKTTDGINWSKVICNITLENKSKSFMLYNPDNNEFIIAYDNDIKFAITQDFNNVSYITTYSSGLSSNEIRKIIWDKTYNRYIILSSQLKLLNYVRP